MIMSEVFLHEPWHGICLFS